MSTQHIVDLSLMSWNILAPCWVNKEWYPSLYELAAAWQARFAIILAKICAMNCDVVFIQEAQEEFLPLFRDKLGGEYTLHFAPNNPTSAAASNGLLMLINKKWMHAEESKVLNGILDPEKGEAIQIVSIPSKNIHLVNLHLDYFDRLSQATKVLAKCEELLGFPDSISLMGGDLNAMKEVYEQFPWTGYQNVFDESSNENITPSYYPDPSNQVSNASVDHLFFHQDRVTLVGSGKAWDPPGQSLEQALKTLGSDHIYIWAKFQFSATS